MRNKFKSIAAKGGLKVHVTDMGYNYTLLVLLIRAKTPDTVIANILNKERELKTTFTTDKPDKVVRTTIKHWKTVYQTEQLKRRQRDQATLDELRDA